MRENTQKLLIWLFPLTEEEELAITYDELSWLLPELTPGGRRSLIHHLAEKRLVRTDVSSGQTLISSTTHGVEAVRREFPVFRQQDGVDSGWSMLVFIQAPKSDPHFRYLRNLLLDNQAIALRRGVYLYPGELPSKILDVCRELYVGAVNVFQIDKWVFGDEKMMLDEQTMLSDMSQIYSGISKEINQLLIDLKDKKRLTRKEREHIFSVFARLYENLQRDFGLLPTYQPQSPGGAELLSRLRSLLPR